MNKHATLTITILLVVLSTVLMARDTHPVSAQAGGHPILVVHNPAATNKFGVYLGEILRAEGLNSFNVETLDNITAATILTPYKVVILAETPLSAAQAGYFTTYVNGGGRLIAMRPDAQIKGLFGLVGTATTLTDGYMKMPGTNASAGLTTETLQIHGDTDQYTLAVDAVKIADLYSDATTATAFPAVASDVTGRGVAFLYDLAKNVVYMRQGNPANADTDIDSDGTLRTNDLFQDVSGDNPWVDRNKIPIPQADEQQRLLARLVKNAVENSFPMPQFWYFPDTTKAMLVATSDAHANLLPYYQAVIDAANDANGKVTIYLSAGGDNLTASLPVWKSEGHSFGVLPFITVHPATVPDLQTSYTTITDYFANNFQAPPLIPTDPDYIPLSRTVRNFKTTWVGWTDAADVAVSFGMGMDANFYHWGAWLQKPDNSWPHGYITGSGQPMKFIKADGTILPYYQQLTQLVDEQFFPALENLNITQALNVSQQLIDASLAGD